MSLQTDLSGGLENVSVSIQTNLSPRPVFQYSPDNVQGPGCDVDPEEVSLPGCSCLSASCQPETCSCLQAYGQTYRRCGRLLDSAASQEVSCRPVFECQALCRCSEGCANRVVQRGLRLRLEVFPTGGRGWGVRTLEPVPAGSFLCEYAGEVIGLQEARRRQLAQGPGDSNYIIAVREHAGRGLVTETFVDPAAIGNVGRFLNHSCLPNLFMVPVRVHSTVPRLALFSSRDVHAQEELTFDYSGGLRSQPGERGPQGGQTTSTRRTPCLCGAHNCTGFLPLDTSVLGV